MPKVKMIVTGRVQGVGFRYMTKMVADRLHVTGIVENMDSGQVYIEASGPTDKLDEFIKMVKVSPSPSGRVTNVDVTYDDTLPDYNKFRVTN